MPCSCVIMIHLDTQCIRTCCVFIATHAFFLYRAIRFCRIFQRERERGGGIGWITEHVNYATYIIRYRNLGRACFFFLWHTRKIFNDKNQIWFGDLSCRGYLIYNYCIICFINCLLNVTFLRPFSFDRLLFFACLIIDLFNYWLINKRF